MAARQAVIERDGAPVPLARRAAPTMRPCVRARSGQVLIIMLFFMVLMAGLVFYVYNIGYEVNYRLAMQNAADASTLAGANWMARTYNVVAMDNVGMAKVISLVPVMDSLPLASKMALDEVTAWEQSLSGQIARGFPTQSGVNGILTSAFGNLRSRLAGERDILSPYSQTLNGGGFDMTTMTFWLLPGAGGAPPHGKLWQAAQAMDYFSQATVGIDWSQPSLDQAPLAGILAQSEAARFGVADHAQVSFLVPIIPRVPARRTNFTDFSPVLRDHLAVGDAGATLHSGKGGAIPDWVYPYRLGPYARLHKWRDVWTTSVGGSQGTWVQDTQVRGGGGVSLGGRRVGSSAKGQSSGHWVGGSPGTTVVLGYTTYGPYSWAMRRLHDYAVADDNTGALSDTFFWDYVDQLAKIKLTYMFRPQDQPADMKSVHYPQWEVDYARCRTLAADPNVRVTRTLFYLVEIASSVPEGAAGWLTPGTYRVNAPPPDDRDHRPLAIWLNGWSDPETWGIPKVGSHIWKDSYWYETTADPEIGIQPATDPLSGQPVWQKVYMVGWYVFGGIDVGGEIEVRNPANWDGFDSLPAPVLLDTSVGDYSQADPDPDKGVRRELFSFLGTAKVPDNAAVTGGGIFSSVNPAKSITAVAQAEVFNYSSWDLWTQNWQAQLVPVTQWTDWMTRLGQQLPDAALAPDVLAPDQVQSVYDFLSRLKDPMAAGYFKH